MACQTRSASPHTPFAILPTRHTGIATIQAKAMLARLLHHHEGSSLAAAVLGSVRHFTAEAARKRRPTSTTVGKAVAAVTSARASNRSTVPSAASPSSPSASSASRVRLCDSVCRKTDSRYKYWFPQFVMIGNLVLFLIFALSCLALKS